MPVVPTLLSGPPADPPVPCLMPSHKNPDSGSGVHPLIPFQKIRSSVISPDKSLPKVGALRTGG